MSSHSPEQRNLSNSPDCHKGLKITAEDSDESVPDREKLCVFEK